MVMMKKKATKMRSTTPRFGALDRDRALHYLFVENVSLFNSNPS
jgi:hypothetical protein